MNIYECNCTVCFLSGPIRTSSNLYKMAQKATTHRYRKYGYGAAGAIGACCQSPPAPSLCLMLVIRKGGGEGTESQWGRLPMVQVRLLHCCVAARTSQSATSCTEVSDVHWYRFYHSPHPTTSPGSRCAQEGLGGERCAPSACCATGPAGRWRSRQHSELVMRAQAK